MSVDPPRGRLFSVPKSLNQKSAPPLNLAEASIERGESKAGVATLEGTTKEGAPFKLTFTVVAPKKASVNVAGMNFDLDPVEDRALFESLRSALPEMDPSRPLIDRYLANTAPPGDG